MFRTRITICCCSLAGLVLAPGAPPHSVRVLFKRPGKLTAVGGGTGLALPGGQAEVEAEEHGHYQGSLCIRSDDPRFAQQVYSIDLSMSLLAPRLQISHRGVPNVKKITLTLLRGQVRLRLLPFSYQDYHMV